MSNSTRVEISPKSVISTILIILAFVLAWKIRFILLSLFTAFVLMSGFAVLADFLHSKGVNKTLSAALAYLISITVLAVALFFILPPLLLQMRDFVKSLPDYANRLSYIYTNSQIPGIDNRDVATLITGRIDLILSNALGFLVNTVSVVFNFITIAVMSFYLLLERDKIKSNVYRLFPLLPREKVTRLADKVEKQLGNWLRGEVTLMVIIGVATYIGLSVLGIRYALPLAIIAGFFEAIPVVGPILSAIPAILVTLTIGPLAALGVAVLYMLIQQFENNLIVPSVMRNATGLDPLLTIIALLVGAQLFGLAGAIIAIPAAAILQVIIGDFWKSVQD